MLIIDDPMPERFLMTKADKMTPEQAKAAYDVARAIVAPQPTIFTTHVRPTPTKAEMYLAEAQDALAAHKAEIKRLERGEEEGGRTAVATRRLAMLRLFTDDYECDVIYARGRLAVSRGGAK